MPANGFRKRTFRSRKSTGRRTYMRKRRKTSMRYRVSNRRKSSTKRRKSVVKGPFASFGNRMISNKKIGNTRWIDSAMATIQYTTGSFGKVYLSSFAYDCGSCVYNLAKFQTNSSMFSTMGMNTDMFACKYQRGRVLKANWTFEFSFPSTVGVGNGFVGNQFIVGVYLSNKEILQSQLTFLTDFEDLKKCGNLIYKRVQKYDRPTRITCSVDVPKCQDSPDFIHTQHKLYPKGSIFTQEETDESYPACDQVIIYPFVVPLSENLTSTWTVRYRASCIKTCEFRKPIVNIMDTKDNRNYPALDSGLGATWEPAPMI
jgi:hypothetical protein